MLLEKNPLERISLKALIAHEWFDSVREKFKTK